MTLKLAPALVAIAAIFLVAALCSTAVALAQEADIVISRDSPPASDKLRLTKIATGFWRPVFATHANDGSNRLFVVEQTGRIWIAQGNLRSRVPFLDIAELIHEAVFTEAHTERGLLGLAFHPDFRLNGYFYVNYTDTKGDTRVVRYRVSDQDPDRADHSTAHEVLFIEQPHEWHNGGSMAFGPDGYLYISVGDGGDFGDPLGSGQNRKTVLGSILRIDVDSAEPYAIPPDNPFVNDADALDAIWAYGLRNVWGLSFDSATGDLYLTDIGQDNWEEINFQAADSKGGENYGWNIWEANHAFAGGEAPDYAPPIHVYDHSVGCAIIGGFVYRGEKIPQLDGVYLSGDFCSGRIWASWRDHELVWHTKELLRQSLRRMSGFGQDQAGEVYVFDYDGKLYRIDPVDG